MVLTKRVAKSQLAEEKYGHRSGTGSFSFMVRGKAEVVSLNKKSRVGTLSIKLEKVEKQNSLT